MNKSILIGRLTADPEMRVTQSGVAVSTFRLAVDRDFKNAEGERDTDFINVVTFNKLAELVAEYSGKGRLVAVHGRIQTRTWDDEEDVRHWVTEIVAEQVQFLDYAKDSSEDDEPFADEPPAKKPSKSTTRSKSKAKARR